MHKNKSQGFAKQYRLCRRSKIDQIFAGGKSAVRGYLRFRYLKDSPDCSQVVISISKRVGHSPARNRMKRLVREAIRTSGHLEKHSLSLAIFVTAKPKREPTSDEVKGYIDWFFNTCLTTNA